MYSEIVSLTNIGKKSNFFQKKTKTSFPQCCQNCIPRVQRIVLRKNTFIIKYFFVICFPTLSVMVVETAFYESSRMPIPEKIYNFMIVVGLCAKCFRFLLTTFRHGCQNCIICVQTNVFGFSKFFFKRERKWPTSFQVNAIGKHRVKNEPIERLIFFPYFNSGRKRMKNFQSFS